MDSGRESSRWLRLDEDSYAILGNAVLLAWLASALDEHQRMKYYGSTDADVARQRREAGERSSLNELLSYQGVLYDAIDGPRYLDGDTLPTIHETYERWQTAANSSAPIARLAVKNIDFTGEALLWGNIASALHSASSAEVRTPIARLGPCSLTRALMDLVRHHFTTSKPLDLPDLRPVAEMPYDFPLVKSRRDDALAQEAAELIHSGRFDNASQAANAIVDKYGWAPDPKKSSQQGVIRGATREAVVDRLGRKVQKLLYELRRP